MAWPTISHHLAVLRDAYLIFATRDGRRIRYELNTSVVQHVVQHLFGLGGKRDERNWPPCVMKGRAAFETFQEI